MGLLPWIEGRDRDRQSIEDLDSANTWDPDIIKPCRREQKAMRAIKAKQSFTWWGNAVGPGEAFCEIAAMNRDFISTAEK